MDYSTHRISRSCVPLILGLSLLLAGCSGGVEGASSKATSGAANIFDAATGSLEDLNIKQRDIPPLLLTVAQNPYAPPAKLTCPVIRSELTELDTLLGPDVKPKEVEVASNSGFMSSDFMLTDTESMVDNGGDFAHDALMGAIRSKTSILPFRGIIRSITGANRHQSKLEEAYQAGKLRRAYLKGLAQSKFGKRCLVQKLPPSAPKTTT